MATKVNTQGINELDITLPGTTTTSTANGITSITNTTTGPSGPYAAKTSAYSLLLTDFQINCTSGTFTVTLPDASLTVSGKIYSIKNTGTGTITVATTSSQLIDGQLNQTLTQWDNLQVLSTGTGWIII